MICGVCAGQRRGGELLQCVSGGGVEYRPVRCSRAPFGDPPRGGGRSTARKASRMWPRSCRRGSLAAGGRSTERVAARRSSSRGRVRRVGVTPPRWGTFQRDISGSTRTAVVVAHGASAPAAGELWEQVSLMEVSKGPVPTPVEPRGPRPPEASSARPVESRESRCPAWSAGPAPRLPSTALWRGPEPVATSAGSACARARCDSEAEGAESVRVVADAVGARCGSRDRCGLPGSPG